MATLRMAEPRVQLPQGLDSSSSLQTLSRHASALDYDAAQQLIQHSQEGRLKHDDATLDATLKGAKENGDAQESLNTMGSGQKGGARLIRESATRGSSQETSSEGAYDGTASKPLALGQVCRYDLCPDM